MPTLLQLAAVPVPGSSDGTPLIEPGGALTAGKPGALMADSQVRGGWRAWRTDTHRYLLHADGSEFLYDLRAEFGEYRDLAPDPAHADTLHAHRHGLATRLVSSYKPLPRVWPY